jgi:hypothetical protein
MSDKTTLPPCFRILNLGTHVGGDGFLLISDNSLTRHSSK